MHAVAAQCRNAGVVVEFVTAEPDGMLVLATHHARHPWEQRLWWWAADCAWSHIAPDGATYVFDDVRHAPPSREVAAGIVRAMNGDFSVWLPAQAAVIPDAPVSGSRKSRWAG